MRKNITVLVIGLAFLWGLVLGAQRSLPEVVHSGPVKKVTEDPYVASDRRKREQMAVAGIPKEGQSVVSQEERRRQLAGDDEAFESKKDTGEDWPEPGVKTPKPQVEEAKTGKPSVAKRELEGAVVDIKGRRAQLQSILPQGLGGDPRPKAPDVAAKPFTRAESTAPAKPAFEAVRKDDTFAPKGEGQQFGPKRQDVEVQDAPPPAIPRDITQAESEAWKKLSPDEQASFAGMDKGARAELLKSKMPEPEVAPEVVPPARQLQDVEGAEPVVAKKDVPDVDEPTPKAKIPVQEEQASQVKPARPSEAQAPEVERRRQAPELAIPEGWAPVKRVVEPQSPPTPAQKMQMTSQKLTKNKQDLTGVRSQIKKAQKSVSFFSNKDKKATVAAEVQKLKEQERQLVRDQHQISMEMENAHSEAVTNARAGVMRLHGDLAGVDAKEIQDPSKVAKLEKDFAAQEQIISRANKVIGDLSGGSVLSGSSTKKITLPVASEATARAKSEFEGAKKTLDSLDLDSKEYKQAKDKYDKAEAALKKASETEKGIKAQIKEQEAIVASAETARRDLAGERAKESDKPTKQDKAKEKAGIKARLKQAEKDLEGVQQERDAVYKDIKDQAKEFSGMLAEEQKAFAASEKEAARLQKSMADIDSKLTSKFMEKNPNQTRKLKEKKDALAAALETEKARGGSLEASVSSMETRLKALSKVEAIRDLENRLSQVVMDMGSATGAKYAHLREEKRVKEATISGLRVDKDALMAK